VAQIIGYMKGKSSIWIAQNVERKMRNFLGHKFWARGYFVTTVGRDEEMIRAYIKNQETADQQLDQFELTISAAPKSNQPSQHPLKPPLAVPHPTSSFAGGYWLRPTSYGLVTWLGRSLFNSAQSIKWRHFPISTVCLLRIARSHSLSWKSVRQTESLVIRPSSMSG